MVLQGSERDVCGCLLREKQACRAAARICVSLYDIDTQGADGRHLIHLILDIQRTFLVVEEFQGLHMAVSCCVVDSIGSTLKVFNKRKSTFCVPSACANGLSLSSLLQLGGLFQQLSHTDHTPRAVFTLSPA